MNKDVPLKIKLYEFHGVALNESSETEYKGQCPLCDKDDHFYVNHTSGLFSCKSCNAEGNVYTFLKLIHASSLEETTPADYKQLAKERGIHSSVLRTNKLALSRTTKDWLIPTFNNKGSITNLHRYINSRKGMVLMATASCKLNLFGVSNLSKKPVGRTLWLIEGHWDYLAADRLLRRLDKREQFDLLAVPGAGTFKSEWATYLEGRNVWITYDNDSSGEEGTTKVLSCCAKQTTKPKNIKVLQWTEDKDNKYDIRDLCRLYSSSPEKAFAYIENNLTDASTVAADIKADDSTAHEGVKPLECTTFKALTERFKNVLYWTRCMEDTFASMLAVNLSTPLGGEPLWMYIIGPPSSGKTTLANCMSDCAELCYSVSKLSGLYSGWREKGKDKEEDAGLIDHINDKTMVIKDFTLTLSLPPATQDTLYGHLRDAFDGKGSAHYLNNVHHQYDYINFSILACVTDEIRKNNRATLGERFLQIEILGEDHSATKLLDISMVNTIANITSTLAPSVEEEKTKSTDDESILQGVDAGKNKRDLEELKSYTIGFMLHKHETLSNYPAPVLSRKVARKIRNLAALVAYMRASVTREKNEVVYRPRKEIGARLANQLLKLAVSLAIVLDKKTIDKVVYRITKKIALDTSYGYQLDITKALCRRYLYDGRPMSTSQIARSTLMSDTTASRRLKDMLELSIVQQDTVSNGMPGPDPNVWLPSPDVVALWKEVKP